jgi:small subunit ribosomal protein S24e
MEIRISSEKENPILRRREMDFFVDHTSTGTLRRYEVRKAIAEMYRVDINVVYVKKMQTLFGTNRTRGEVEIYESPEIAKALVTSHIQTRNLSAKDREAAEDSS